MGEGAWGNLEKMEVGSRRLEKEVQGDALKRHRSSLRANSTENVVEGKRKNLFIDSTFQRLANKIEKGVRGTLEENNRGKGRGKRGG